MNSVSRWRKRLAGALCALCLVNPASADTLLDTGTPGGFLGYYGFDVFVGQSVAIAFTPGQDYAFDTVSLWLMSNDYSGAGRQLTISLQTDAGGGPVPVAPSGTALESWAHVTGAVGWTPVLETLNSITHPVLSAGTTYWIVAESSEPAFVDPVWVAAGNGPQYTMGNIDFQSGPHWQVGLTGGPPGAVITATAVPEPAALALGLLGLPLMLRLARRRSN
jgi:hypothetical protein